MKSLIRSIKQFVINPRYRFSYLTELGLTRLMSDECFVKKDYYYSMGRKLNLSSPRTYNEKIQWLKLYDHKPIYTLMVDKARVKGFVKKRIGSEYIIPTIGVWDCFAKIDFSKLPNQFVLKCTHDSGGLVICKDKEQFDRKEAKKKINHCLRRKYFYIHREWPYKNVRPRIIAEPYMEDRETGELRDYKIFTFDGKAKALFIASGRQKQGEETTFDFFDINYNHLNLTNGHPNAAEIPQKPENFDTMVKLAEILARGTRHLRVDFYECNGKVYFGELTFSHWSGLVPFEPEEWDSIFGSWITLPNENGKVLCEKRD